MQSNFILILDGFLKQNGINSKICCEYKFNDERKWRFDYAIPEFNLAIEIEGGSFKKRTYKNKKGEIITTIGGRHNSGVGFIKDMEKYNNANVELWHILRFTEQQTNKTETFEMILKFINNYKNSI